MFPLTPIYNQLNALACPHSNGLTSASASMLGANGLTPPACASILQGNGLTYGEVNMLGSH